MNILLVDQFNYPIEVVQDLLFTLYPKDIWWSNLRLSRCILLNQRLILHSINKERDGIVLLYDEKQYTKWDISTTELGALGYFIVTYCTIIPIDQNDFDEVIKFGSMCKKTRGW